MPRCIRATFVVKTIHECREQIPNGSEFLLELATLAGSSLRFGGCKGGLSWEETSEPQKEVAIRSQHHNAFVGEGIIASNLSGACVLQSCCHMITGWSGGDKWNFGRVFENH